MLKKKKNIIFPSNRAPFLHCIRCFLLAHFGRYQVIPWLRYVLVYLVKNHPSSLQRLTVVMIPFETLMHFKKILYCILNVWIVCKFSPERKLSTLVNIIQGGRIQHCILTYIEQKNIENIMNEFSY